MRRFRREDRPGSVYEAADGERYVVGNDGAWRRPTRVKLNKKQRRRAKKLRRDAECLLGALDGGQEDTHD